MKPSGPHIALSLRCLADQHKGANPAAHHAYVSTARRMAQDILDSPNNGRLHKLGLTMLGIDAVPDEQWSAPVPSVEFSAAEVARDIDNLSVAWERTPMHRMVALCWLAWHATQCYRAIKTQQQAEFQALSASNGGHTSGMLNPTAGKPAAASTNDGESGHE